MKLTLAELGALTSGRVLGDAAAVILGARTVFEATDTDVAPVLTARDRRGALATSAGCLLVDEAFGADHAHELPCACVVVEDVGRALRSVLVALTPLPAPRGHVHERAVVEPGAVLGARVVVEALAVIEAGAVVGDDSVIGAGAVLRAGVVIGARCVVGPGCVLGDEGFVYAPSDSAARKENRRVPHLRGVILGDDVELGAHVCVDRGLLRDTRIGDGCKIDNLVQIGHDVVLGKDVVVVAQVGIAGEATLGDGVVLAGQVGVKERVVIGDHARVGGQSAVIHDVAAGAVVMGTPAIPHTQWLRAMVHVADLAALQRRVRYLERALSPQNPTHSNATQQNTAQEQPTGLDDTVNPNPTDQT